MKMPLSMLLICVCAGSPAAASSCVDNVVTPIHFAKGAVCWYYAGKATHFTGRFLRGQRVVVEMSGEVWSVTDTTSGLAKPDWTARRPEIVGPRRFFVSSAAPTAGAAVGRLETVLPETGEYKFGFSPCVMWHQYGHVAICTSNGAR